MITAIPLLPLFQKFITHSRTGRRRNKNGTRLKDQSISNYVYCYKLLESFSDEKYEVLVVYQIKGNNNKEHIKLRKYYRNLYKNFTEYLYRQKKCYDNYVGQTIKQLRTFFVWLNQDMAIQT